MKCDRVVNCYIYTSIHNPIDGIFFSLSLSLALTAPGQPGINAWKYNKNTSELLIPPTIVGKYFSVSFVSINSMGMGIQSWVSPLCPRPSSRHCVSKNLRIECKGKISSQAKWILLYVRVSIKTEEKKILSNWASGHLMYTGVSRWTSCPLLTTTTPSISPHSSALSSSCVRNNNNNNLRCKHLITRIISLKLVSVYVCQAAPFKWRKLLKWSSRRAFEHTIGDTHTDIHT